MLIALFRFQTTECSSSFSNVPEELSELSSRAADPQSFMRCIQNFDVDALSNGRPSNDDAVTSSTSIEEDDSGVFSQSESAQEHETRLKRAHPKPEGSWMTLIARALLPDRKAVLADIYATLRAQHPYFRLTRHQTQWRNSVRHNLSVNECFIKEGRAPSGRGCFWTIHPACRDAFLRGDFSRRRARDAIQSSADHDAIRRAQQVHHQMTSTPIRSINAYDAWRMQQFASPFYYHFNYGAPFS
jgi:hypothetical protein